MDCGAVGVVHLNAVICLTLLSAVHRSTERVGTALCMVPLLQDPRTELRSMDGAPRICVGDTSRGRHHTGFTMFTVTVWMPFCCSVDFGHCQNQFTFHHFALRCLKLQNSWFEHLLYFCYTQTRRTGKGRLITFLLSSVSPGPGSAST